MAGGLSNNAREHQSGGAAWTSPIDLGLSNRRELTHCLEAEVQGHGIGRFGLSGAADGTFSRCPLSLSLVSLPLLMGTPVLLDLGPPLMASFNRNYLSKGTIFKYSHTEGKGFNIGILGRQFSHNNISLHHQCLPSPPKVSKHGLQSLPHTTALMGTSALPPVLFFSELITVGHYSIYLFVCFLTLLKCNLIENGEFISFSTEFPVPGTGPGTYQVLNKYLWKEGRNLPLAFCSPHPLKTLSSTHAVPWVYNTLPTPPLSGQV